ncbi:retinaldehyde-binding protein 1 isoform X1 [Folsomia candida]|uniref:retinaldehyde-binding protein 1 isoform X1 n=1 Tax=Folsomia candida TaxID=158441 RepID=UPI000B8FD295|nr:retinaldehyde-binding protein 1 isoform X1 [Folsomia candida]XP_021952897.1 retinaldehyde-binding protein 1 isoform X1 [Folsomia candida]
MECTKEPFDLQLIELKGRIKEHDQIEPFSDILDDNFLTGFLRGKKGDVDKTVKCLEHYIQMRTVKYKNFTKTFRPSTVKLLDQGALQMMKHHDPLGRVVLLVQIKNWFPSQFPVDEAIAAALFMMDEGIRHYFATGNEFVTIVDCAGACLAQARTMTLRNIFLMVDMFTKNVPSRPKAIHFVNHGFLIHNLRRVITPLLEKKLRERIRTKDLAHSIYPLPF